MINEKGPFVEDDNYNKISTILKTKEFENVLQEELTKCIKQHQKIFHVCQVIDDVFSTLLLIIFGLSIGYIIFILYSSVTVRKF